MIYLQKDVTKCDPVHVQRFHRIPFIGIFSLTLQQDYVRPGRTQPMSLSSHDVCLYQVLDVRSKGLCKVQFLAL